MASPREGFGGRESVGIEVVVNFDGTESLHSLQEELRDAMSELNDQNIDINFSATKINRELERLGEKFKETREIMEHSFSDIDLKGLNSFVESIKELGELNSKLDINIFQKMEEGAKATEEAVQGLVAKGTELEEVLKETADASGQVTLETKKQFNYLTDSAIETTKIQKASGEIVTVVRDINENIEKGATIVTKTSEKVETLYKNYEKASGEVIKLASELEALNDEQRESNYGRELESKLRICREIADIEKEKITSQGLGNEKLEKSVMLNLSLLDADIKKKEAQKEMNELEKERLNTTKEEYGAYEKNVMIVERLTSEMEKLESTQKSDKTKNYSKTIEGLKEEIALINEAKDSNREKLTEIGAINEVRDEEIEKQRESLALNIKNKDVTKSELELNRENARAVSDYVGSMQSQMGKALALREKLATKKYSGETLRNSDEDALRKMEKSISARAGATMKKTGYGELRPMFTKFKEAQEMLKTQEQSLIKEREMSEDQSKMTQAYAEQLRLRKEMNKVPSNTKEYARQFEEAQNKIDDLNLKYYMSEQKSAFDDIATEGQLNLLLEKNAQEFKNLTIEQKEFSNSYMSNLRRIAELEKEAMNSKSDSIKERNQEEIDSLASKNSDILEKINDEESKKLTTIREQVDFNLENLRIKNEETETQANAKRLADAIKTDVNETNLLYKDRIGILREMSRDQASEEIYKNKLATIDSKIGTIRDRYAGNNRVTDKLDEEKGNYRESESIFNNAQIQKKSNEVQKEYLKQYVSLEKKIADIRKNIVKEENVGNKDLLEKELNRLTEQRAGLEEFLSDETRNEVSYEVEEIRNSTELFISKQKNINSEKELAKDVATTTALLKERLSLQKKLVTNPENTEAYQSQIKELESKISQMRDKYGESDEVTDISELEQQYETELEIFNVTMETKEATKEEADAVKTVLSNLRSIATLQREMARDEAGTDSYRKRASEVAKLREENRESSRQLSSETGAIVENYNRQLKSKTEIIEAQQIQIKNSVKERENAKSLAVAEKEYLVQVRAELGAKEQLEELGRDEVVNELTKARLVQEQNTAMERQREILSSISLSNQKDFASQKELYSLQSEQLQKEKEESATIKSNEESKLNFLKEQEEAYKTLLRLEEERARATGRLNSSSVMDKDEYGANLQRYANTEAQYRNHREYMGKGNFTNDDMESDHHSAFVGSGGYKDLIDSQARLRKGFAKTDVAIEEYEERLKSLGEKYGYTIKKSEEFKRALSNLDRIGDIRDLEAKNEALREYGNSFDKLTEKVDKSGEAMHRMFDRWKEFTGYTAINLATQGILGSFDSAWDNIKKINDAYTEVHKVYNPDLKYNNHMPSSNWMNIANSMGQKYGFSTADSLDAIYQSINYGYGAKNQALSMAKSSMILSNTGKITEKDASSYLISIMKGYYGDKKPNFQATIDGHKENLITSIIDKLSQGGMYYPITSGGIAEALKRGGSSMAGMGSTLEQSIQLIEAGNYSRQDPAVVGNAMKSLYGSLTQIFTQNSKTDLRKRGALLNLTGNIYTKKDGELVNPYEVFKALSEKVHKDNYSTTKIAKLSDLLGGKDQLGVMFSVLNHLTGVIKHQKTLDSNPETSAYGSAGRENLKYMNSIQGRLNRLKEGVNRLWMDILKTSRVDAVLDFGIKVVKGIDYLVNKFGLLTTAVTTFFIMASLKNHKFGKDLFRGISRGIMKSINFLRGLVGKGRIFKLDEDDINSPQAKLDKIYEELEEFKDKSSLIGKEAMAGFMDSVVEELNETAGLDESIEAIREKLGTIVVGTEEVIGESDAKIVESNEKLKESTTEILEEIDATNGKIVENVNKIDEDTKSINTNTDAKLKNKNANMEDGVSTQELTDEELANAKAEDLDANANRELNVERELSGGRGIGGDVENDVADGVENDVVADASSRHTGILGRVLKGSGATMVEEEGTGLTLGALGEGALAFGTDGLSLLAIPLITWLSTGGIEDITKGVSKIKELNSQVKTYQTYASENTKESVQGMAKTSSAIGEMTKFFKQKDKYGRTNSAELDRLNKLFNQGKLNASQMIEYKKLMKQVAKIDPSLVDFKGANGNPYVNMTAGASGLLAQLKQIKEEQEKIQISTPQAKAVWGEVGKQQEIVKQEKKNDSGSAKTSVKYLQATETSTTGETKFDTASETAKWDEQTQQDYNSASAERYRRELQERGINDTVNSKWVIPYMKYSNFGKGLTTKNNATITSFLEEMNKSGMSKGTVDDIAHQLSNSINLGGKKSTTVIQKAVANMKTLRTSLEGGKISYTAFESGMAKDSESLSKAGILSSNLLKKAFSPSMYKTQENTTSKYIQTMEAEAKKLSFKKPVTSKKLKTELKNQYDNIQTYISSLEQKDANSKRGKTLSSSFLGQIFGENKESGTILANKLGITYKTATSSAFRKIMGDSPALEKDFTTMMTKAMTGGKITPEAIASFKKKLSDAEKKASEVSKQSASSVSVTVDVKPNTVGAKKMGYIGGESYKKSFKMTAVAMGKVLHDKNVKSIAYIDGQWYKNGIKLNAKEQGEVQNYVLANTVGKQDGGHWKKGVVSTAVANGMIKNSNAQASSVGRATGSHWYSGIAPYLEKAWKEMKGELSGSSASTSNEAKQSYYNGGGLMGAYVIPHGINIQSSKDSVKSAFDEVHSFGQTMWANHLYGGISPTKFASGGVSAFKGGATGGKGGKGGATAVGSPMGAVSFATMTSSPVSDFSSTGVSSGGGSGNIYEQAGNQAGESFYAGFTNIALNILNEEATSTERLKQISQSYFDEDQNNLKLTIDLNQRLNNTLTDIGNTLTHNKSLQSETENGYKTISLMTQELSLLDKKKEINETLEGSYTKQLSLLKQSLKEQGLAFGKNGNIVNAVSRLQGLEKMVNDMPDQIAQTKTSTKEEYTKTPYRYYKYGKGTETETPYHYSKYNKGDSEEVSHSYDKYSKGHYVTKKSSYWDYKLGKEVSRSWKEYVAGTSKEVSGEYRKYLAGAKQEVSGDYKKYVEGQKTLETGYKYSKHPVTSSKTTMVSNEAKSKASQNVQNIQNMVNAYNNMLHQTLPQTVSAIDSVNSEIQGVYNSMLQTASSVESQITQIIQKQVSERKQAIQNSTNAEVDAYNKVLTAMQQKHSESTYETGLETQKTTLAQLQSEVDNAELDHSLVGMARLSELKKQLKAQQTAISQTVSSHEYQNAQNKINKEIADAQAKAKTETDDIDKTWNTKKIAETVKQAILSGSFTDVQGQVVKTKQVWVNFADTFNNGLGVMGNKMKDDFIKNLEEAQKIMGNISEINKQMGYYNTSQTKSSWIQPQENSSFMAIVPVGYNHRIHNNSSDSSTPQVNFNAPLVQVSGNVGNTTDLHKFTKDLEQKVTNHIVKNLRNKGAI